MEHQAHGFLFEKEVSETFFIKLSNNYIAEWDGETTEKTTKILAVSPGTPVSIKTTKKGTELSLGDYYRQASHSQDFILIDEIWEPSRTNKQEKIIIEKFVYRIKGDYWQSLFAPYQNFVDQGQQVLNSVSHSFEDDKKWQQGIRPIRQAVRLYNLENNGILQLRFKRDHKHHQKRIQCAIRYKDISRLEKELIWHQQLKA